MFYGTYILYRHIIYLVLCRVSTHKLEKTIHGTHVIQTMHISYVQYYNVSCILLLLLYIIYNIYLSYLPRRVPRVCPHLLLNIVTRVDKPEFFFFLIITTIISKTNWNYKCHSIGRYIFYSKILIKLLFFFLIRKLTMWSILET